MTYMLNFGRGIILDYRSVEGFTIECGLPGADYLFVLTKGGHKIKYFRSYSREEIHETINKLLAKIVEAERDDAAAEQEGLASPVLEEPPKPLKRKCRN